MGLSASNTNNNPIAVAYVDASGNPVLAAAATPLPVILEASGGAAAGFDVAVTPTVTNGPYSGGDIVGGLMTFTLAAVAPDRFWT